MSDTNLRMCHCCGEMYTLEVPQGDWTDNICVACEVEWDQSYHAAFDLHAEIAGQARRQPKSNFEMANRDYERWFLQQTQG